METFYAYSVLLSEPGNVFSTSFLKIDFEKFSCSCQCKLLGCKIGMLAGLKLYTKPIHGPPKIGALQHAAYNNAL
jgi:hypothetical protein